MRKLLKDNGESVCLIKPQFEAGRENIGKKGVVKDINVHIDVLEDLTQFAVDSGFDLLGVDYSPVKGPEGNIEYLMYIKKSDNPSVMFDFSAQELAEESHTSLDK